jgi:hypothetical protein
MASKIVKQAGAPVANEFELSVAQALVDLESSVPDLKQLRALQISAAKEVRTIYTIFEEWVLLKQLSRSG